MRSEESNLLVFMGGGLLTRMRFCRSMSFDIMVLGDVNNHEVIRLHPFMPVLKIR